VFSLVAEAAAQVGRHEAQLGLGKTKLGAHVVADVVRRLRAAVQRVMRRDHAARFYGAPADAVVHEIDADDLRSLLERGFHGRGIAARPAKTSFILNQRKRLIVDFDPLCCILGEVLRLGKHGGDRLADMAHRVAREGPARRLGHAGQHPAGAHRADAVGFQVFAREDRDHSRDARVPGSNSFDKSMRVRRAHDGAMEHPGEEKIVDEAAAAGEVTPVLDAADRRADHLSSSRNKSNRS
jgi:hypothetical protein